MNNTLDRVFAVTGDGNLVRMGDRCETDNTNRAIVKSLQRLGYSLFTVHFPMKDYATLKHRVAFMVSPTGLKDDCHHAIRKIVTKFNGTLAGSGWLVTGEGKVYSSVPDHFHSGLGELILVELAA